jgi:uncharacterized membrane protein YkvA (DUF1232 family)
MTVLTGIGYKPLQRRKFLSRNRRRAKQHIHVSLAALYEIRAQRDRKRQRLRLAAVVIYFVAFTAADVYLWWSAS